MRLVVLVPALLALSVEAASPGTTTRMTPVAVELFTSQGCSSCPPADALIEKLAKEPNIVAITRPVTYWDSLGWKDTLAREMNTILRHVAAKVPASIRLRQSFRDRWRLLARVRVNFGA